MKDKKLLDNLINKSIETPIINNTGSNKTGEINPLGIICPLCEIQCESCESACESGCQGCQNACQIDCQSSCQSNCQSPCERVCQYCENCENVCEYDCMKACLSNCQCTVQGCQACQCSTQGCQTCQCSAQGCQTCQCSTQGCQTCQCSTQGCQTCQASCEKSCQNTCQSVCQSMNQNADPLYEYEYVHYGVSGINPGTGNYSKTFIDMSIDAPGFKLNISRTYNSKDDRLNRPFGRGWTFGFEGYVQGTTSVAVRLPNGGSFMFTKNGDGTYTAVDSRNKLEKAADGIYTLTTKDQYKYKFNSSGYMVAMVDRNGNTITISVDSNGKVTNIADAAAQHYSVVYNTDGLVDTITEQTTQRRIKYEYLNKLLVKVVDPMNYYTTYSYDSYNFLIEVKDQNGNIINKMEYDHSSSDNLHKLTKLTDAYGNVNNYSYDVTANKTTITDSNGRTKIAWYDTSNYVTKIQDSEGRDTITEYYLVNNENKYGDEKYHTDRNGNRTEYTRDTAGNVIKITYPDTSFEEYQYDDKNNKILEKDRMGNVTYYIYDTSKVNLIKKVQPLNGRDVYTDTADPSLFAITKYEYFTNTEALQLGYKELGLLKTTTTPEGNTITYTYDAEGNVKTVTDPETLKPATYEYNSIGLKTAEISAKGHRTEFQYNKNMLPSKTILKSPNNETIVITYDHRGRKTKEISPNQYNAADDLGENNYNGDYGYRYLYYTTGLLWKITDPTNNVTEYTYDLYGNKKTEKIPDGGIFEYEYDILNRTKKVLFKENSSAASVLLEEFFYDVLADKKTQVTHRVYFSGTEYADTKNVYDFAGRLISTTKPDGTVLTTNYNLNGTVNSTIDENGKSTYFKYDGLSRLTEKWVPFEEASGSIKYTYYKIEYDKDNNKKAEKTSSEKVDLYGVPVSLITINYEYYKNGKVKRTSDTAGRITEYWYDDDKDLLRVESLMNGIDKQITVYENNYMGLPNTKTVYIKTGNIYGNDFNNAALAGLVTSYTYDKNRNLKTETAPDNVTTTYLYDSMNRRIEISEPGLDETGAAATIIKKMSYNFEGKIETVTDANSNMLTNVYNKRGFLEKVINPDGGTTACAYDLAGRKTDEVMPNNYDSNKAISQMSRTSYTYDKMNRLITKTEIFSEKKYDPVAYVWRSEEINRVSKAYKYDEKGRAIKELDAAGFDSTAETTTQDKINNGYGVEYKYNLAGNVIEMLDAVSKDRGLAYTVKNEYDAIGRKIGETDALGRIKSFEYDAAGNVISVKHKDTITSSEITLESKTYDHNGNVLSKTDGNGNMFVFEYNELNKVRCETYPGDSAVPANIITYQYDVAGNLRSRIDSLSAQELYTYDNEGRVLTKTQQKSDGTEAVTTSTKYDRAGNSRFECDGNNNITEKTYDVMNRVKTVTIKAWDINNLESVHTNTFSYDKNGNKTGEADWRGNTGTFVYDEIGRLIEKKDPYTKSIQKLEYNKNNVQVKAYDGLNNATVFEYDRNNRLIKTTDPEGHITAQSLDEVGNLKTKTDGMNNITTYNYDGLNRIKSVKNAKGEITEYTCDNQGNVLTEKNSKGNITTFEYGVRNQVIRRIDHGGRTEADGVFTYADDKVESYTYFEDGRVKTIKDRKGVTTAITYDIHGRMRTKAAGQTLIAYTYDSIGNMLTITDSTGLTIRKYDALNRVVEKTSPDIGKAVYVYDIITGVDAGETGERATDTKENITLKIYDKLGRVGKVTSEGNTTTYEYDDNGNKKSVQYQDGSREEFTYYKDNLLKALVNKKADGTVLESYSYTYDGAHNQTSKVDKKGTTTYTYDVLNRLETVTEPSGKTTAYEFDGAGNRTKEIITENGIQITTTYNYNEQNRLMSTVTIGGAKGLVTYGYDNNGNIIREDKGTITTHTYDEFNQLNLTVSGTNTIKARYNGEGKRVKREVNGDVTRFLYEGDNVVLEVDGSGTELARNIYGNNLIQRKAQGQLLKYFYNGHGDVTALVDDTGTIVATYYYDSFGNMLEETGTAMNPYRYRGYEYEKEIGQYYLKSRYYNPEIGRFMSEDNYMGDRVDPLSLNLYTYCNNEPIMHFDSTGHYIENDDGAATSGGASSGKSLLDKSKASNNLVDIANKDKGESGVITSNNSMQTSAPTEVKSTNQAGMNAVRMSKSKITNEIRPITYVRLGTTIAPPIEGGSSSVLTEIIWPVVKIAGPIGVFVFILCIPSTTAGIPEEEERARIQAHKDNQNVEKNDEDNSNSDTKGESKGNLPNQGTVKGNVDGAPPVDAGKQGKHVPGHNNNDPSKSQWPQGQDGVDLTQSAWQNGKTLPDGTKVWDTGKSIGPNGETGVRVHMDGKGNLHGYPVNPSQYLK